MSRSILTLPAWDVRDADTSRALHHPAHEIRTVLAPCAIIEPPFESEVHRAAASTLIAWSGRADDSDPDPFASDPRSWLPGAMPEFFARLESLDPTLRAHRTRLLIRPHARHIVSDAPRAAALLNHQSKSPEPHVGLALDPVSMLEPSMLAAALDHIRRTLESLAHRAAVIILTNIREPASPDGWFTPAPLTEGLISPVEIARLAALLIPPDRPLAILPDEAPSQIALLREAGYTPA